MRRAMLSVLMCMVITATVVPPNASAGAGKKRVYEGVLSDGGPISISLLLRDGRPPAISLLTFGVEVTCEDGTTQSWMTGLGWFGERPSLPSHALDLDLVDPSGGSALHIHGKVQALHGSGTLLFTTAALTADEQAQLCTTSELTWTVDRTAPPTDVPPPTEPLQVVHFTTEDGTQVTLTRLR